MKKLHFDYYMQIDYSIEVTKCNFTIKCFPQNDSYQQIEHVRMKMHPNTFYSFGRDGLRNRQIYGLNEEAHKTFYFHIEGDAHTGLAEYAEEEDEDQTMIFRHPHGLNVPGETILQYYKAIAPAEKMTSLKEAEYFMGRLYQDFQYQANTTNVKTTAEEAFSQGYGVCQDYAHIFLALLHLAGIPARYVTGLLIGEGQSHAWVEVLYDHKWYGLDPTNNTRITDNHIKIGIGRDAQDCTINRGIMHGGGLHSQTVKVTVKEITEEDIAEVISNWTGIPAKKITEENLEKIKEYDVSVVKSEMKKIYKEVLLSNETNEEQS